MARQKNNEDEPLKIPQRKAPGNYSKNKRPRRHEVHNMGSREDMLVDVITEIIESDVESRTNKELTQEEDLELRNNITALNACFQKYGKLIEEVAPVKDEITPYKKDKFQRREFNRMKASRAKKEKLRKLKEIAEFKKKRKKKKQEDDE